MDQVRPHAGSEDAPQPSVSQRSLSDLAPEWLRMWSRQESFFDDEEQQKCECGNVFMPDAVFCRKCGLKRPDIDPVHGRWEEHAALWHWSGELDRKSVFSRQTDEKQKGFRFIDRMGPFGQAIGKWSVTRVASKFNFDIQKLHLWDAFHSFIDGGSLRSQMLIWCMIYVALWLLFAVGFWLIDERCGLGIEGKFLRAYYLSLETAATIGYGVPDVYYNDCWEGGLLLTIQFWTTLFYNSVVIGCVFIRMTRPQMRSQTILFSKKAVIQEVDGSPYFMFQVCEAKTHDLLEASVRCYCIRRDRNGDVLFHSFPMRIQQPDDDVGAMLMMALPTKVVHRIDNFSPLSPSWEATRRLRRHVAKEVMPAKASGHPSEDGSDRTPPPLDGGEPPAGRPSTASEGENGCRRDDPCPLRSRYCYWSGAFPEAPLRQADSEQGVRSGCCCPTCGASFSTLELLLKHNAYNAVMDKKCDIPDELCHMPWTEEDLQRWGWASKEGKHGVGFGQASCEEVALFLRERYVEVIVIVEGIEPTTSSTLQARHSYRFPEEVVWDMDFVDCALAGPPGAPCILDLGRFHDLEPAISQTHGGAQRQAALREAAAASSMVRSMSEEPLRAKHWGAPSTPKPPSGASGWQEVALRAPEQDAGANGAGGGGGQPRDSKPGGGLPRDSNAE